MKKYLSYICTALALSALTACTEDSSESPGLGPNGKKELIAFSQEGSAMTRGHHTRTGFASTTKTVLRIKAEGATAADVRYAQTVATASAQTTVNDDCNTEYGLVGTHSHLSYVAEHERYWDDAFGRDTKLTVYAVAIPNQNDDTVLPSTILDQASPTAVSPGWYTVDTENTKIDRQVSTVQTATTRLQEDLTYSNNIRADETVNKGRYNHLYNSATDTWAKSMQLGRMIWQPKTVSPSETTGKFDLGHLVFKHALSWFTIVLKEGSGFDNTVNTDFVWTRNQTAATQNITLKGFPTSGKFDVSSGAWSDMVTNVDITQLDEVTTTPVAAQTSRQLEGYVLPGTNLYNTTANVIEFEIDHAKYYVTGTQIASAIRDFYKVGGAHADDDHAAENRSFTTTEAGKHYYVNLIVSKKGVENVTAAILDWESVNSEDAVADNTYCTFTFEDRGTKLAAADGAQFDLYRVGKTAGDYITGTTEANYEWATGYTNTYANKSYDTNHWKTTDWFWPNNLTYYHFRAAGTGASASDHATITTDATNGDYFAITSGTISGSAYKDYVWGAPFKDIDASAKLTYSTTSGFDNTSGATHQIAQALGATKSQINMLLFHVTSQVFVNVKTTTGADKVALKDDTKPEGQKLTKVEILNFLPNGKVRMGTGLVSADDGTRTATADMTAGTWAAESGTTPEQVTAYSYGMVPQSLSWGTGASAGTIGLRITTPDGNKYVIADLSQCTATVSATNLVNPYTLSSGSLYSITSWYPHYQYNYTITLKQTGIANITAAVLPWESVTGDLGTINLEN